VPSASNAARESPICPYCVPKRESNQKSIKKNSSNTFENDVVVVVPGVSSDASFAGGDPFQRCAVVADRGDVILRMLRLEIGRRQRRGLGAVGGHRQTETTRRPVDPVPIGGCVQRSHDDVLDSLVVIVIPRAPA
jgi:hypothetical protein